MNKEKSTFEKVLLMIMSCIVNNCDIIFDIRKLPPVEIYKPIADGIIIIKEDFEQ